MPARGNCCNNSLVFDLLLYSFSAHRIITSSYTVRCPLSSMADSRTGHQRNGDKDVQPPLPDTMVTRTTRIVVCRRQCDQQRPRAQNRPSVFWPRMSPLGSCASSSTSQTRSAQRGNAFTGGQRIQVTQRPVPRCTGEHPDGLVEEERKRRGSGGDYGTRVGSCGAGQRGLEEAAKGVMG